MAKFLSEEWAQQMTDLLMSSDDFKSGIANVDLTMGQVVTGAPDGDVHYYLQVQDGAAKVAIGEAEAADVTAEQDYATAVEIQKGELNMQNAFMTGRIKVTGDLTKIMQHQAALSGLETLRDSMEEPEF